MTVRDLMAEGSARLRAAAVETPYLDSTVLLAYCMGMTKERLFASLPAEITEDVVSNFRDCLDKREAGSPVSYIRRTKEFFGREFYVDERVLVPRPDTEVLVEQALRLIRANPKIRRVHDCCTGSGCIAITVQAEEEQLSVSASDISRDALAVCSINAKRLLGHEMALTESDLLESVPGPFDMILSNPPYLTTSEYAEMEKNGWPEPRIALEAGNDGLLYVRRLVSSALEKLSTFGYLVVEAADAQYPGTERIMREAGFTCIEAGLDLAGRRRVTIGRKRGD